jgi:hypothetical protein
MRRNRLTTLGAAAAALALCVGVVPAAAQAPAADAGHRSRSPYTFAVIGDIPYGTTQVEQFPRVVAQINADPDVRLVDHLGDIKNGSSVCSDDYFRLIRSSFDRFRDPLVYTPGDNEWTDCHRPNNGAYNPLERLDALRTVFFPRPGQTLGRRPALVESQARQGYPENVHYRRAGVSFGVPHLVGSNNGLAPWTGSTGPTPAQTAAAVELIHDTFEEARRHGDRAVVLMTQADMFDPTVAKPTYADYYAFQPIVRAIAQETADYGGPVYLLNGDSHVYNSDRPLAAGSKWLDLYGIAAVSNLERITVDGSDNNDDYLKVTIQPRGRAVLTWERVPYTL